MWGHNGLLERAIVFVSVLEQEGILEGYLSEMWSDSP